MPGPQKFSDIDQYISTFPAEVQTILEKLREAIHAAVPSAQETISYHMPTFTVGAEYLVHFAAWKEHVGFYGLPTDAPEFREELDKYVTPKGAILFMYDEPIPYELVQGLVSHKAAAIMADARG